MVDLRVDMGAVDAAVRAARSAVEDKIAPARGGAPDPRFDGASKENRDDGRRAKDRTDRVADGAAKAVKGQRNIDAAGTSQLNRQSTVPSSQNSGSSPLSQQQYQQQIRQMMSPQMQQQGANWANQLAPAAQQTLGMGAGSVSQYPPGTIEMSRSQLAALLAAVESGGGGGEGGAPGGGSNVASFGEVSNKGALSVDEVVIQKTGAGVLSKEETDAVILKALEANGITDREAQARWLPTMRNVIEHESTRNPDAGNGYDSNAVGERQGDGLPAKSSRGLAQTIPSTFAAYHVQGTSTNIYDPVASVAASVNYISHRYGGGVKDGTTLGDFNAVRSGGSYVGY
ncbi:transglycosylase SLT domain-containing protein [Gordonia alkaliphila]|uniref:transglycosylase SLT domain-containing protein n=1 Tax=Gordonia alkaliphila TaxID=1053547 RepID=UPI001FF16C17|nr:transglycosylase SLT domain-containing protein [Gordonia alkaliphila]MCK0441106.1 transglycosylase SLT domain-containing protein [Gordonia alkaliphila]